MNSDKTMAWGGQVVLEFALKLVEALMADFKELA